MAIFSENPTRYKPPMALLRWVMMLLAVAGLGWSLYLLLFSLLQRAGAAAYPPGCGAASGCEAVLSSRWGSWLGIPVTGLSAVVYLVMFGALTNIAPDMPRRRQRWSWMALVIGAVLVIAAAGWFIGLQLFVLKAYCKHCLTVHGLGLVLSVVVILTAPIGKTKVAPQEKADGMLFGATRTGVLAAVGLLLAVLLLVGQLVVSSAPPRPVAMTDRGAGAERAVGITVKLRAAELPVLGSREAKYLLVALSDYTCPRCRRMHRNLAEARKRYGEQVAVVCVPVPLDSGCNPFSRETEPIHKDACEYARLALAVWLVDAGRFAEYDEWLWATGEKLTVEAARAKAEGLVDAGALKEALAGTAVKTRLETDIYVYHLLGYHRLPQVIAGGFSFFDEYETPGEFCAALEKALGLTASVGGQK